MILDFRELPSDGILFEQLIREILIKRGYETFWTGVGIDSGRDIVILEELKGPISTKMRKWIVSCKHNAHSNKSVGLKELGNVVGDCTSIQAEGYILACSTYPSSSVVKRLEEITHHNGIITKIWDAVEIEKQILYPETFSLIHTFFPKCSVLNQWRIYNAYSPSFWAANYKGYFFFMSSRNSATFPDLPSVEAIIYMLENVNDSMSRKTYKEHRLRPRCVYFNDKLSTHTAYFDYIFPNTNPKQKVLSASQLRDKLLANFSSGHYPFMNFPDWDVRYVAVNYGSDNFELDHKDFYEPYISKYETGITRNEFLHKVADREDYYTKHNIKVLTEEDVLKMFQRKK